jgi:hypothetical protein
MKNLAIFAAVAMLAGLGALPATTVPAGAQGIELEIGPDGSRMRLRDDCNPRYERCRREDWRDDEERRDDWRRERRRFCTEDRALDKAERMGIRRARIVGANRRVIEVRGRDRFGQRVHIAFGRERNCPVLG